MYDHVYSCSTFQKYVRSIFYIQLQVDRVSNPLRTHVKNFLLYKFWEIGPSFINKYTVSVSIYERLAGVTSKLAQNEYTGPANNSTLLPETKSPNIRTEAHGSGLELKFGCYIFYIGNPNTYVLPGIPGIPGIYTNQIQ